MYNISEEDEDDVSSLPSHHSLHMTTTPMLPARPTRGDAGRVGVPVLPPMNEGPPPPPRHSSSQTSFGSGIAGSGGVARGPLPPLPSQTPISTPGMQQQPPRPPPVRSRPQSTSGIPYGRTDSSQFGPGKQEKEVRILCDNIML